MQMNVTPARRAISKNRYFARNKTPGPLPLPVPFPTTRHQLRLYFPAFACDVAHRLPASDDAPLDMPAIFADYESRCSTWKKNIPAWHDYMILTLKPYIHSIFRANMRHFIKLADIEACLRKHDWKITLLLFKKLLKHAFSISTTKTSLEIDGHRTTKQGFWGIEIIE
jgi:hypothetical protein